MSIATALTNLQEDITNARTAIMAKGGTVTTSGGSSQLAMDIATIPTAPSEVEEKDIIFIDYDGTILYSYTLEEVQALTELPSAPNHTSDGLVFQKWNWTLEDIQSWGYPCEVGALYNTVDGATWVFINIKEDRFKDISFDCFFYNGTKTIDWGDGTVDTTTGTGTIVYSHSYNALGEYIVKINTSTGSFNYLNGFNFCATKLYRAGLRVNHLWHMEYFANYDNGNSLSYSNVCRNLPKLKSLVLSNSDRMANSNCWDYTPSLEYLSIPKSDSFGGGSYTFRARNLKRICVAGGQTLQGKLYETNSIKKIVLGDGLTTVVTAFGNATSLEECRMVAVTPPVFANSSVLTNIPTAGQYGKFIMLFPYASVAYLTSTNYPNPSNYIYVGYKNSVEGEILPTIEDTYTLTWYSNKTDAFNETNPITIGNGKEVYARYEVTP